MKHQFAQEIRDNQSLEMRPNGHLRVRALNDEPSMTQQQFKEDCDVNLILAKYMETGSVTHTRNVEQGAYLDLANLPDYQEQLDNVIAARTMFEQLPAMIQKRFAFDPQQLIDFLGDPNNRDEAIKIGLVNKKTVTPPSEIQQLTEQIKIQNQNQNQNKKSKTQNQNVEE